jgi:hypothetical protein
MAEKREETYKTEEQIKQEAKARREAEARALPRQMSERAKKAENFWYHYKWHSIAAAVLVFLGVFFVRDIFFRPRPDATIVMVTEMPFGSETLDSLEAALTELAPLNAKGKKLIAVDYINFIPADDAPLNELAMASSMKLMAVLAAGTEQIFLLDASTLRHITGMSGSEAGNIFEAASVPVEKLGLDEPGFEGLSFYIRDSEQTDEGYLYAKKLMENIAAGDS